MTHYYFCSRRSCGEHHLAGQDLCGDPPGLHQTHQPVVSTQVTIIRCYQHYNSRLLLFKMD